MDRAKKFGAFEGVYVPALLTILGVIMYLRLGWIVGQAGIYYTLGIIFIAHIISITTGLSISSIATDKKIRAGGIYYILSRSLGLPIGGAIGATIFLATALSIAFYLVGFSESFLAVDAIREFLLLEQDAASIKITASTVLFVITILAFISTSLAVKAQYFVFTAIVLSLLSIVIGLIVSPAAQSMVPSISPITTAPSMDVLFAIFFPAVTGFTVGVAMSGDLKNPKTSLPTGTLMAIFTGLIIYVGLTVVFALFVDRDLLLNDTAFLLKIAFLPSLVLAGIWGATLSSALGGILGGPRILQTLSRDKLAPGVLGKGYGINNEPRIAIITIYLIAQAGVLMGDLNTIARVVSMFFIAAYAFINLAFALESWASTDFRPSFRVPRWVGWLGFGSSFIVMVQIDFVAMIIAFILIWITWYLMKRRRQELEPGDVWQSVWANLVRRSVHSVYTKGIEERNWKPNIMLFSGNPETKLQLTELGKALIADHGLLTIINLQQYQEGEKARSRFQQKQPAPEGESNPGVFTRLYFCHDIYQGIENLAETYGFAGIEPNTVLMGWTRKTRETVKFVQMIQHIIELDLNLLLMDYDVNRGFGKRKTIDIWWRGSGNNGNLALNLVKFLWLSEGWKDSHLRLMIENKINDERENIYNFAREVLDNLRVNAEIVIINNEIEKKPFYDLIRVDSGNSDITFLSIPDIETGQEEKFMDETNKLCADLGTVVLIRASTQFKRLHIGIRQAALPLRLPVAKPDLATHFIDETEIKWPHHPPLAGLMRDFSERVFILNTDLIGKGFGKILTEYQEVIKNAQNRVNATYKIIEKRLNQYQYSHDKEDALRAFYKLSNNSFTRYQQILTYLNHDLLEDQQRKLEIFFAHFEKRISELMEKLPEKAAIFIDRDELKHAGKDIAGIKSLRRKKMIGEGRYVKLTVNYKKILQKYYPQTWHIIRKILWQKFNDLSQQYLFEQQNAFQQFRDSLFTLENALLNDSLNHDLIFRENREIEHVFATLEAFIDSSRNNLLDVARQENIKVLTLINTMLDALNPNAVSEKQKAQPALKKHELRAMEMYPADWKQLQTLYINQNLLDITLSAIEYKLWHFIRLASAELKESWQQTEEPAPLQMPSYIIRFIDEAKVLALQDKALGKPELATKPDSDLQAKIKEIEDTTQERINAALSRIPSHIELMKPDADTDFTHHRSFHFNTQTIEVSKLVHFIVQNNLLMQMQADLKEFAYQSKLAEKDIIEIIRLIKITLTPDKEESVEISLPEFFEEQKERTLSLQERIHTLLNTTHDKLQSTLNNTNRLLSLTAFIKTAENLRLLEKRKDNDKVKGSRWRKELDKARVFARKYLIKIWYDRSKRVVYAHQIKTDESDTGFPISKLHTLNEEVTVKSHILSSIPPYYQQLFLRKNNYFMDFWQGKKRELKEAEDTLARHDLGYNGALMIKGEHNSGKSFFVNYIVHMFLSHRNIYTISPPFAGSVSETEFARSLQRATEGSANIRKILDTLPEKPVIIIEDLELWWEKTHNGLKVLKLITNLVEEYGSRILFIITSNSHAYNSINRFVRIDSVLLSTIYCSPFNAEELKDIILQRHKSGNMQLVYQNTRESDLRSWDFAQLFNTYFNYTRGNVGLSLQTWMANIVKTNEGEIFIKRPRRPDTTALNKLNAETLIFLVQFVLHKRLNAEKIHRIMMMPLPQVKEKISLLRRAAIIAETQPGVYILNPNLHAFIRERLIEKELL